MKEHITQMEQIHTSNTKMHWRILKKKLKYLNFFLWIQLIGVEKTIWRRDDNEKSIEWQRDDE